MGQFDAYYEGGMAPPMTVNGRLLPTPNILSPAQIYQGIYPAATPRQMSSIGPGPNLSGGYSFLQDMIDASTPGIPHVPGPSNTTVANKTMDQLRGMPATSDPYEAYAGVPKTPAQQAIDLTVHGGVPLPRVRPTPSVPLPTWGPSWGIGINSMMPWERSSPGAAPQGDPWANDRFGIPVVPMKGYVTGNRAASPAPQQQAALANRPIIYTAPVAAGNFAEGSPNQSFEKDHGMGSVTKSMASSSRWNTGY